MEPNTGSELGGAPPLGSLLLRACSSDSELDRIVCLVVHACAGACQADALCRVIL